MNRTGTINAEAFLEGTITPIESIEGQVSSTEKSLEGGLKLYGPKLKGAINAEASLEGTLTSHASLSGEVSAEESLEGGLSIYRQKLDNLYTGPYEVIPKVDVDQELETAEKLLSSNIEVKRIPTYTTSNEAGGYTFYIGGD